MDAFPRDALVGRVNADPAVALGADGQDHSDFERNPFKRLQGMWLACRHVRRFDERRLDAAGR